MVLFIYLTQEDWIARVAAQSEFVPPLGFNSALPFYLMLESTKTPKANMNERDSPHAILVYNSIDKDIFCQNISKIASRYARIFIVHHTYGLDMKEIINSSECSFKEKCQFELGQNEEGNAFYSSAVNFINANSVEEIQLAKTKARHEFGKYDDSNNQLKYDDGNPF